MARKSPRLMVRREGFRFGFGKTLIVSVSPKARTAPRSPCGLSCSTTFLNFSLVGSADTRIVGIPYGSRNASLTWNCDATIDLTVSKDGPEYEAKFGSVAG